MKKAASNNFLSQFLFLLCIGVTYLDNFELTFAIWSITALITLKPIYSKDLLRYAICLLAIMTVAFVVLLYNSRNTFYVIRDITYMLKPVIGLVVGYQLCRNNSKNIFKTVVYTGFIIACIHLSVLGFAILFKHARTLNDLRTQGGYFSDFEVYAMIILIFYRKFELQFTPERRRLLMFIIGFSATMYFARTNFIQFILLFLALKGYFKINVNSIMIVSSVIIFSVIAYSTILYINPKRNGPGIETLLYKIKIAPVEAFKTKIDKSNWKDLNDNYRSFENITTVKQVISKGRYAIMFGEGLGSQVDLKQEIWLDDLYLRYISILHNGFMTVFLKSGLLGIFIYLYSIFLLFKQNKSDVPIIQNINLLLIGTGVFLIFSNWVFLGVYNKSDNKSILIGLLLCYKAIYWKTESFLKKSDDEA